MWKCNWHLCYFSTGIAGLENNRDIQTVDINQIITAPLALEFTEVGSKSLISSSWFGSKIPADAQKSTSLVPFRMRIVLA